MNSSDRTVLKTMIRRLRNTAAFDKNTEQDLESIEVLLMNPLSAPSPNRAYFVKVMGALNRFPGKTSEEKEVLDRAFRASSRFKGLRAPERLLSYTRGKALMSDVTAEAGFSKEDQQFVRNGLSQLKHGGKLSDPQKLKTLLLKLRGTTDMKGVHAQIDRGLAKLTLSLIDDNDSSEEDSNKTPLSVPTESETSKRSASSAPRPPRRSAAHGQEPTPIRSPEASDDEMSPDVDSAPRPTRGPILRRVGAGDDEKKKEGGDGDSEFEEQVEQGSSGQGNIDSFKDTAAHDIRANNFYQDGVDPDVLPTEEEVETNEEIIHQYATIKEPVDKDENPLLQGVYDAMACRFSGTSDHYGQIQDGLWLSREKMNEEKGGVGSSLITTIAPRRITKRVKMAAYDPQEVLAGYLSTPGDTDAQPNLAIFDRWSTLGQDPTFQDLPEVVSRNSQGYKYANGAVQYVNPLPNVKEPFLVR